MREVVSNVVGRYALGQAIASGGMATLHLGRIVGSAGFARIVAIKRAHPQFCADPSFVEAFADEARLAARIRHPNVVPTLDVVSTEPSADGPGELLLVMEYVDGESLSALSRAASGEIPLPIVVAIVSEMLHGLHSAHEAKSETGEPLGLVHRDVSPQNVLVGADGVARLVDFGIARATGRVGTTNEGELKGKIAYMAPEQIRREDVTRKVDIFAAGVVLWELLTGERLFASDNPGATLEKILVGWVAAPSTIKRDLPQKFDEIALRALDPDPNNRFETARDMAVALEDAAQRALGRDVAAWVEEHATNLVQRRALVAAAERALPVSKEITLPPAPPSLPPPVVPPPASRPASPEETCTAIREPSPFVSDFESDPTVMSFGASDTIDPARPISYPSTALTGRHAVPKSSRAKAVVTVALAAAVTVFLGRYANGMRPASAAVEPPPAPTLAAPARAPAQPSPMPVGVPIPAVPFVPSTVLAASPSAHATGASMTTQAASVRKPPKPRATATAAPAHSPCVAKLDPATGKTIYKGDCD